MRGTSFAGRTQQNDASDLQPLFDVPFQLLEIHVISQVHAEIRTSSNSPAGVLELFFMDKDRNVCPNEVLQSASVVQVKMPDNNDFDVLDVVSSGFDRGWQLHVIAVYCSWKHICEWRSPFLQHH